MEISLALFVFNIVSQRFPLHFHPTRQPIGEVSMQVLNKTIREMFRVIEIVNKSLNKNNFGESR
jgi:hypothetical protein